jgi:gliding motility-associated-like protein
MLPATAQLKADFIMDQSTGCAPLKVSFSNTSTGISNASQYVWQLGNGNPSMLKDPEALYTEPGVYTVNLTVTDNGKQSTIQKTITVFRNPDVEFSPSVKEGCVPIQVNFSAAAKSGDGTIANYTWDFGDGNVVSTTNANYIHTYQSSQPTHVSLTVISSNGCYTTLEKKDLISLKSKLIADFSPDTRFICKMGDPVRITNKSVGQGALTYAWDFGDGTKSADTDPVHTFNKAGAYTVTLRVSNAEGCSNTISKTDVVNVANFKSDFNVPADVCPGFPSTIKNISFPVPDSYVWQLDGVPISQVEPGDLIANLLPGGHSVMLINRFGTCTDTITKQVVIKEPIKLKGFVAQLVDRCQSPNQFLLKDTSKTSVGWLWNGPEFVGNGVSRETSVYYLNNGTKSITLKVIDAAGCIDSITQTVEVRIPRGFIRGISPPDQPVGHICMSGERGFEVTTLENIVKYEWQSGDGQNATVPSPTFQYNKLGTFTPQVKVTTDDGCVLTFYYINTIRVREPAKVNFEVDSVLCGNIPVILRDLSVFPPGANGNEYSYHATFGDANGYTLSKLSDAVHRYADTGIYTIQVVLSDRGCRDTMTKRVRVLPSMAILYPGFGRFCEGNRGKVSIGYNAKYALSGNIDFGDGTSIPLDPGVKFIPHEFPKTGWYKVILTSTNGTCTGKDTLDVNIYTKQAPLITADKTDVCTQNDFIRLKISNLERIPLPSEFFGSFEAIMENEAGVQMAPKVEFKNNDPNNLFVSFSNFTMSINNQRVRLIIRHQFMNCRDTTNWITLSVGGPTAIIKPVLKPCVGGRLLFFTDSSWTNTGRSIVRWDWYFGSEQFKVTTTQRQEVSYAFRRDGLLPVRLVVTDDRGCSSSKTDSVMVVNFILKAAYSTLSDTVSVGARVRFTNTSQTSDSSNTAYTWSFGDGNFSSEKSPEKMFSVPGLYTINLKARNLAKGCEDSVTRTVLVKAVSSSFSFSTAFLTNKNCLPLQVRFRSDTMNVVSVFWDFGDGATSIQFDPVHLYTKPGIYVVTQKAFSDNGTMYLNRDTIAVSTPSVDITTDVLQRCAGQNFLFRATSSNGTRFIFDFGDGTIQTSSDSVAVFAYRYAGVYQPGIVVADRNGCLVPATTKLSIKVDSLALSLANLPAQLCAPKTLTLSANIFAAAGQSIQYQWRFSTAPADTSSLATPVYTFSQAGTYSVQLTASTASGCVRTVSKDIVAFQGLGAAINGPGQICQKQRVNFTATTATPGTPQYQWTFPDGSQYNVANPPAFAFNTAGTFNIRLVVSNSGCNDTIIRKVVVDSIPNKMLALQSATTCKGTGLGIQAFGGVRYEWTPVPGLQQTIGNNVVLIGVEDVTVRVRGWTPSGCEIQDSVNVKVIQPQRLSLDAQISSCAGVPVTLKALGTDQYQWIGNTNGLSDINIAQPVAKVNATTRFTVVGNDAAKCFADTATIEVLIFQAPQVNAGPDAEVSVGGSWSLSPLVSNDVRKYQWSPDKYLSCTSCPSPTSKPLEDVTYILTVTNDKGCTAKDTVSIAVLCNESKIYIPNAFTPNGDGNNDRFTLKGSGIKQVKSLRIFDRFGTLIFEKTNFAVNDPSAAWDGKIKGMLVPVGSYVYLAELSCDAKSFVRKGSVTVLY